MTFDTFVGGHGANIKSFCWTNVSFLSLFFHVKLLDLQHQTEGEVCWNNISGTPGHMDLLFLWPALVPAEQKCDEGWLSSCMIGDGWSSNESQGSLFIATLQHVYWVAAVWVKLLFYIYIDLYALYKSM